MAKVQLDEAAMDEGETRFVHENGRTLEMSGENADGEWFAHEADDGDELGECFAQGYYVRDGDDDVMQDEEGNELARGRDGAGAALLAWVEGVLEA